MALLHRIRDFLTLNLPFPPALLRWLWWGFLLWQAWVAYGYITALITTWANFNNAGGVIASTLLWYILFMLPFWGGKILLGWLLFSVAERVLTAARKGGGEPRRDPTPN